MSRNVVCIPQVKNLEDEFLRACQIKSVMELTGSKSMDNFKKDLIKCTNVAARLQKCNFDSSKLWSLQSKNCFSEFKNNAEKIKL